MTVTSDKTSYNFTAPSSPYLTAKCQAFSDLTFSSSYSKATLAPLAYLVLCSK